MRKFKVELTLMLEESESKYATDPSVWNWVELLDLNVTEDVEVNVTEIN